MNQKMSWQKDIYRKYIFGDIASVPRVWARSTAPETEEVLCGCRTDVTLIRELLSDSFSYLCLVVGVRIFAVNLPFILREVSG
jgi:hypothetical protein